MPQLLTQAELDAIRAEFADDFRSNIGVWIDGSHMTVAAGNYSLIQEAISAGFKPLADELASATRGLEWDCESEDDDTLRWLGEEALDHLNSVVPDGLFFDWFESDLFLSEVDSDDDAGMTSIESEAYQQEVCEKLQALDTDLRTPPGDVWHHDNLCPIHRKVNDNE